MRSVLTRASAAIDRSVVRIMERRMARPGVTPRIDPTQARARLVELADHYSKGLGHPSPMFAEPTPPRMQMSAQGDGPLGTQVVDLSWASDYAPFHPLARDPYLAITENQTAHARWWTSERGRPTIVMIHGWGGGNHWVTFRTFLVPYWLRHGWDVVAFQLPFHGNRAPGSGLARSGALFPSPNPLRTNEGFAHAIYDLRALAMFLRERGSSAVGPMGMSLGGYTTALWASIAGPGEVGGADFAVAMIPAVAMAKVMWSIGEQSRVRQKAAKAGITEDLLGEAFAVHAPTTRAPRVPADRRFVIAGRGDRITGPEQAEMLAAHWDVPVMWFEGGHLAQIGRSDALRTVRRSLGALEFSGRKFRA